MDLADVKARNYDFRHHAVSRGLENPRVSLEAARAYYGWFSDKMIRRYSHSSVAALREVAAAIDRKWFQREEQRERQKKVSRRDTTSDCSKRLRKSVGKVLIFSPAVEECTLSIFRMIRPAH